MVDQIAEMCALFPEFKLKSYYDVITFENFYQHLSMIDVIKVHGINTKYLDTTSLKVHPHDILIQARDLSLLQDSAYRELMAPYPKLWKVDLDLSYDDIVFPLTSAFNRRFQSMPCEWIKTYFKTMCDKGLDEQHLVSLANFCAIQCIPTKDRNGVCLEMVRKYIFSVIEIKKDMIKDIYEINNPYYNG